MSNFYSPAYHPPTGTIRDALWVDDYFGRHQYAVLFDSDEKAYKPEEVAIPRGKVFVALPKRLTRDQAEPICSLKCRHGDVECHGDCDCNPDVQKAWAELRDKLVNQGEQS
jgi:hypothetical protein